MRPVISYDDITQPSEATQIPANGTGQPPQAQLGPQPPSTHQYPTKRRRTNQSRPQHNGKHHQQAKQYVQHWDEPGGSNLTMSYGGEGGGFGGEEEGEYGGEEEEEEEEENGELTYEDIWDDSALIDAWNSASAEYEEYHGKGSKAWKEEPVKKSPLWYNTPQDPSKKNETKGKTTASSGPPTNGHPASGPQIPSAATAEGDSQPLDFDTYVPTHDPSLAPLHPPEVPGPDYAQYYLPPLQGPMVNQDEAFQRALSAMYWGGYWTAVYHYQRQSQNAGGTRDAGGEGKNEDEDEDEKMQADIEDEDLVSTQR